MNDPLDVLDEGRCKTDLVELRRLCENVVRMLDDPEPGIGGWWCVLGEQVKAIASHAGASDDP